MRFKDSEFCIKTRFLNAVLNRWESNYTQEEAASYLNVSKRTVASIEKGECTTMVTILNYIHLFGKENSSEKQRESRRNYFKNS